MRNSIQQHWFFKYKLYHLLFWAFYNYAWWALYSNSMIEAAHNVVSFPFFYKYLGYVLFQAAAVYFNLYYLFPKFLIKGKYLSYLTSLLGTLVVASAFITGCYYLSVSLSEEDLKTLYNSDNYVDVFKYSAFPSILASTTLAMSIKLSKNWLEAQQKQRTLEKEKLETELKFLKSQFNPHFLFNTINSIFVLIHKNPDRASESLAKFSELLRYQLYECNEAQIPLEHEISYLENFIELEKLRLDHHFELYFQNNIEANANWRIAPFLLIPFVENAFKHVSQEKDQVNWINIRLELEDAQLKMQVSNSHSKLAKQQTTLIDYGGIGLKNVKRRLDLLYAQNYSLQIVEEEQHFLVELSLNLEEEMNLVVQDDLQSIR